MTTEPEHFTYSSRDGATISAYRWVPEGPPRGVVQLTHGMGEHVLRYAPLARALNQAGFVVAGQDHRGHGTTSPETLGEIGADGWTELVNDVHLLTERLRTDHPGLPLVLLGHSMGSFAAQQDALDHSAEIDGLALTGTAMLDLLEPALDLDQPLDLAMFNAPFAPARTDYDWLSRDEEQVDLYVADARCGFGLDAEAGKAMFLGARQLGDPARMAGIRDDLPVYIGVGDQDPVNAGLALVHPFVDRLRDAGVRDVTLHTYPGARHEVFNETNRDEVVGDLIAWLDRVVPARA
jgi:alpha-beta hydrolase superfamily lysophospholipase